MSKITWQPWKSKFPPNPALASWKTYKSIFLISGLPKFAHQGCHISVGRKDRISKTIPDIGQKVILKCPVTGIFGAFCLSFLLLKIEVCLACVLSARTTLLPPQSIIFSAGALLHWIIYMVSGKGFLANSLNQLCIVSCVTHRTFFKNL